jgi:hypothetical protein
MLEWVGAEPAILMEDDILVGENFRSQVEKVIDSHRGFLINFFSRRKKDLEYGARFEVPKMFWYNCCIYFPKGYAASIRRYYDVWPAKTAEGKSHGYDILIQDWLEHYRLSFWQQVPSLVQHREGVSSINPKRNPSRQSKTFQG